METGGEIKAAGLVINGRTMRGELRPEPPSKPHSRNIKVEIVFIKTDDGYLRRYGKNSSKSPQTSSSQRSRLEPAYLSG